MNIDYKLNSLKNSLNQDTINLKLIQQQIKNLTNFNEKQNYEYLNDLLYPEKRKGVKIPSQIPRPTCTFQLNSFYNIKTSNQGALLVKVCPFFLADTKGLNRKYTWKTTPTSSKTSGFICEYFSRAMVSNWLAMDGETRQESAIWNMPDFDLGQTIPENVYESYRLVSASLRMKYIGPLEEAQGTLGGAIINRDDQTIGSRNYVSSSNIYNPGIKGESTTCPFNNDFTVFDILRDAIYSTENSVLEGVRLLYFPIDNSYEEFIPLTNMSNVRFTTIQADVQSYKPYLTSEITKNNFWWFIYGQNLQPSKSYFRLEMTCNFECLPSAALMNYIPISISICPIDLKLKKKFIEEVQEKAVQKLNNF